MEQVLSDNKEGQTLDTFSIQQLIDNKLKFLLDNLIEYGEVGSIADEYGGKNTSGVENYTYLDLSRVGDDLQISKGAAITRYGNLISLGKDLTFTDFFVSPATQISFDILTGADVATPALPAAGSNAIFTVSLCNVRDVFGSTVAVKELEDKTRAGGLTGEFRNGLPIGDSDAAYLIEDQFGSHEDHFDVALNPKYDDSLSGGTADDLFKYRIYGYTPQGSVRDGRACILFTKLNNDGQPLKYIPDNVDCALIGMLAYTQAGAKEIVYYDVGVVAQVALGISMNRTGSNVKQQVVSALVDYTYF